MSAMSARSNAPQACGPGVLLAALLCVFANNVWAIDDDTAMKLAFADYATERARPQFEISASPAPRADADAQRSPRIDMTLLSRSRSAVGLSLGLSNLDGPAFAGGSPAAPPGPSMDVGLRWRSAPDGNYRLDVTAWRRLATPDALELVQQRQPTYGARVEMQVPSPHNGFVADRGFLGMQLESGARITVRRKGGGPMLYYRNQF